MQPIFKVETHLHTSETSACGYLSAREQVTRYHKLGYQAIMVTDHLHASFVNSVGSEDWSTIVDAFLAGYRAAKSVGDELGINVLLGAEIRFAINDSDYLLYGFDESFLYANPFLHTLSPQDFFEKYRDQLLIIHAHPYRNGNEVVFIDCVHGIETHNANPRHNNYNDKALLLHQQHPHMPTTSGSDAHRDGDEGRGGLLVQTPVTTSVEFKKVLFSGNYTHIPLNI